MTRVNMMNDNIPTVTAARLPRAQRVLPPSWGPLVVLLVAYASMSAILFALQMYETIQGEDVLVERSDILMRQKWDVLVVEAIDVVLLLLTVAFAGRPERFPAAWHRLLTWLCSLPAFALILGLNLLYHFTLKELLKNYLPKDLEFISLGLDDPWWAIGLVCLQPAVIEELFFRYLLQGHLRSHVGIHAAVWVAAVLFGMAHLGNIAGWPVLIMIGAGLGYARVLCGGMALPILLHGCHNFSVLLVEQEFKT